MAPAEQLETLVLLHRQREARIIGVRGAVTFVSAQHSTTVSLNLHSERPMHHDGDAPHSRWGYTRSGHCIRQFGFGTAEHRTRRQWSPPGKRQK